MKIAELGCGRCLSTYGYPGDISRAENKGMNKGAAL